MSALRSAAIFSDSMVMQAGKPVAVWGRGEPGRTVSLVFTEENGSTLPPVKTVVNRDGRWETHLPPHTADRASGLARQKEGGQGRTLTVFDGAEHLVFANVVFGEVWFAGGQSNMEMPLSECGGGAEEIADCADNAIRFYQPLKMGNPTLDYDEMERETPPLWKCVAPATAAAATAVLSAIGYFFARRLVERFDVPVGIINCSWGGTSIAAWIDRERLATTAQGRMFLEDYECLIAGKSDDEYRAELQSFQKKMNAWKKVEIKAKAANPALTPQEVNALCVAACGEFPWPEPASRTSPYCPGNLHETMVSRVAPYTLRGFLYYQGEEDCDTTAETRSEVPLSHAAAYDVMMEQLVADWRAEWQDTTREAALPFLYFQLPMYIAKTDWEQGNFSEGWPFLREKQNKALSLIPNAYMVCIIDCGEFDNIHPRDKKTPARRLFHCAEKYVYMHECSEYPDYPVFTYAEPVVVGGKPALRLHFMNTAGGLVAREKTHRVPGEPAVSPHRCFDASYDGVTYHPVDYTIEGDTIFVHYDVSLIPSINVIRYAWYQWGPTPIYSRAGLPLAPFRGIVKE